MGKCQEVLHDAKGKPHKDVSSNGKHGNYVPREAKYQIKQMHHTRM